MIARIRISTRVTKSLMNASLLWVTEAVNEAIQHFGLYLDQKSFMKQATNLKYRNVYMNIIFPELNV